MKKILIIPILLLSFSAMAQPWIRTFYGPRFQFIYDTSKSLSIPSLYLTTPCDTCIGFDSSKVVTDVTKINDSTIRVFKGGIAVVPDLEINGNGAGSGGGSNWTVAGSNIYPTTATNVGIGTTTPTSKLTIRTDALAASPDSSAGVIIENKTLATATPGFQVQDPAYVQFKGHTWKSAATAESRPINWRIRAANSSGSSNPVGGFAIEYQINNGAWTNQWTAGTGGSNLFNGSIEFATGVSFSNTGGITGGTAGVQSLGYAGFGVTGGSAFMRVNILGNGYGLGLPTNTTTQRNTWTGFERLYTYNSTIKLTELHNGTNWNSIAQWGYTAVTSTYPILITDFTVDCTSGTFTTTLPTAVGAGSKKYTIVNSGSGTITIATTSSQTFTNIDGTPTTLTLSPVGAGAVVSYELQSNNVNWIVTGKVKNE